MLEHIIPYVLKTDQWWCGINITNHGFVSATINLTYYNDKGVTITPDPKVTPSVVSLGPGQQTRFPVDVVYGWIKATSPDNVTILQILGEVGKSTTVVPIEKRTV
jgi:hypothetical protein